MPPIVIELDTDVVDTRASAVVQAALVNIYCVLLYFIGYV